MVLEIDPERCQLCRRCKVQIGCLGEAVSRPTLDAAPVIDVDRCYGCGMCTLICPYEAVVEKHRVEAR